VWVGILVAAGAFQAGRGAPIEAIPFAAGALALVGDGLGRMRRADVPVARPSLPGWVVAAGVVVSAALIGLTPEFGWVAGALVTAAGLAAVAPTWGRRVPGFAVDQAGRRGIRTAAIVWAALAIALCLWELLSFFLGLPSARADWEHPALSDLVKPAIDAPLARAALFALWVLAGWAFVRRGWGDRPRAGARAAAEVDGGEAA